MDQQYYGQQNAQYGVNYGMPMYGMAPMQRPQPKNTQPLNPEQINHLKSHNDVFKIEVTQDDILRSMCTHKENGCSTLVQEGVNEATGNPVLRCTICGETFELMDLPKEKVQESVDNIINLLQSSKTMYLDISKPLAEQYYQLIPLLKLFPELYDKSVKNFMTYENAYNAYQPQYSVSGGNAFAMMNGMLANPYAAVYGNMYQMQPQQGFGQPMYGQQPPMAPQMQQQAAPQPWGYPGYGYPQAQPQPMFGNPF